MAASVFNYQKTQVDADNLLLEFGMGAVLRRVTATPTDRPCTVCIIDYLSREKQAELANPTDRKVIMSPLDPTTGLPLVAPDNELDQLVTFVQPPTNSPVVNEILPLTCTPRPTAPAGVIVLWEFTVRR